jgi:uncharacterized membrane-anchored protein YhcB (DUF1043 family)
MPQLEPRDWLALLTAVVTVVGVYWALRLSVSELKLGQTEIERKVDAVHKRLDHYGQEITRIDKDHVRLEERVKALKESQQFRLRNRVSEPTGETPMFADGVE